MADTMTFAFYGRVGSTRLQDIVASNASQVSRARQLIQPRGGVIVAEYFDIGHTRALPWQRRPKASQLLAILRDPARGFDAVLIGEPQRAFYGNQFSLTSPIFEHFGVGLWVPEVGGPIDPGSEAHDLAMPCSAASPRASACASRPACAPPWPPRPPSRAATSAVDRLTATGWPTPERTPGRNPHRQGIGWTKHTVRAILCNPHYTGYQVWNRQHRDKVLLDVDDVAGYIGRVRWNPTDAWIYSEQPAHEPLVALSAARRPGRDLSGSRWICAEIRHLRERLRLARARLVWMPTSSRWRSPLAVRR